MSNYSKAQKARREREKAEEKAKRHGHLECIMDCGEYMDELV